MPDGINGSSISVLIATENSMEQSKRTWRKICNLENTVNVWSNIIFVPIARTFTHQTWCMTHIYVNHVTKIRVPASTIFTTTAGIEPWPFAACQIYLHPLHR